MADEQPQPPGRKPRADSTSGWYRMTGAGLEFVVAVVLLGGLGWYLDRKWDTSPWLLLVGCGLGFAVGLYALIQMARSSFHD